VIALAAWMLLNEAERARSGAVLAGAVYRDLLVAMSVRDDYVGARSADRSPQAERFMDMAKSVQDRLHALGDTARTVGQRDKVREVEQALSRYVERMRQYIAVTEANDKLINDMSHRAAVLVRLANEARNRQHASNADIIASLTAKDQLLGRMRDIEDNAHELRAALWTVQSAASSEAGRDDRSFALGQLRRASDQLADALKRDGRSAADELIALTRAVEGSSGRDAERATEALRAWCDRLLKVEITARRALHEEIAQLLTYSVQANETEQATQNIAIATLKLGQETSDALASRDPKAAAVKLEKSSELAKAASTLPISPLIQSDMIDAITQWRGRLGTTIDGLGRQNDMIADMDHTAAAMVASARSLNDMFTGDADQLGSFIRSVLVIGATFGLLFGSGAAFLVARSITNPLRRLQGRMLALAADPLAGQVGEANRRDELGDMARAANFFVMEIGRREKDLRQAKDRTEEALAELRQTQADLIQAEKLASLGQLVAGVAHEINTPLGIALTTATLLGDEARDFERALDGNQLPRSRLVSFLERMKEGSRLLFVNLGRAADLVHSFKQVAVDQVSDDCRRFDVKTWLEDVIRSLGPLLRKTKHEVVLDCPADLRVHTYPGALAQVLTNLVMNAVVHAYAEGQAGQIAIRVSEPRADRLSLTVQDNGKGIPADQLGRIFDPFFTTARSRGNTGLGLHIVYNLVTNKLQGRIDVVSRPGTGTTFRIDLPRSVTGEMPIAAAAAP
jgi:signal transduction histidine kinase